MMRCIKTSYSPAICAGLLTILATCSTFTASAAPVLIQVADPQGKTGNLEVEVTKKGLGKEVVIRKGSKEWFMLIEVTTDNTVVVRQEKDQDTYLVDESETHDRALTSNEVDVAIEDFINSVKQQVGRK
jgi:hypothetical protein